MPIPRIIDLNEDYVICTYACKGLGGVFSQNGYIVCYESRKLKWHERHYATHDLEVGSHSACLEYVEALPHGKNVWVEDIP